MLKILSTVLLLSLAIGCHTASPPTQPATGPGGAACKFQSISAEECADAGVKYWIFEPATPKPDRAPLIVFNHGWAAMHPFFYSAWIDHLVKRGNIVVFPLYGSSFLDRPRDFTPDAIVAVKAAIARLRQGTNHVRPDLDKVAFVGHSMGGIVAANLAALCHEAGLPRPKAVMCVEPGKTSIRFKPAQIRLENLSAIAPETLLLVITGDRDKVVRDMDAKRIFYETPQIPATNKNFIQLLSDHHGWPALRANHFAPFAANTNYMPRLSAFADGAFPAWPQQGKGGDLRASVETLPDEHRIDALDFYGTWKLLDGLLDAAHFGANRRYALGNTPEQRFMGLWSDGVPAKELRVLTEP